MPSGNIEKLISYISRFPSLGQRSAARIIVHLLKKKQTVFDPFLKTLIDVYENAKQCEICGNIDIQSPCSICKDQKKDNSVICVVADISDLWTIERTKFFKGKYHVLGNKLSAINGIYPDSLNISSLYERIKNSNGIIKEIILALSADIDGQTTLFFVKDKIKELDIKITTLSHGVPVGSDIEYLDEGTLIAAINQRREVL